MQLRLPATLLAIALLAGPLVLPAQERRGFDRSPDLPRTHDPSTLLRAGDTWWYFATGTGIVSRRSIDLLTWTAGPPVFETIPAWIPEFIPEQRGHLWAPDAIRVNDRYLLYYSVSSWGKNTSAIALATNPTLDPDRPDHAWTDEGIVVQSSAADDYNAIDPALLLDRDGRLWMAFGSFWSGIRLVELDPAGGRLLDPDTPPIPLAYTREIEAPALLAHNDWYYLFVNWGLCCRGTNSTYEIRVGRSRHVTGPYLDRDRRDLRHGGGTRFLASEDRFIGPGHAAFFTADGHPRVSFHFYDRDRRGAPTLGIRRLEWDPDDWPVPGRLLFPSFPDDPRLDAPR